MTTAPNGWFHRRGDLTRDGWESIVSADSTGWAHTGLRIGRLADGDTLALDPQREERLIVPLEGGFTITHTEDGEESSTRLHGRRSVFAGRTDMLYLSSSATAVISGSGRVAVASSPTSHVRPTRRIPASDVPVELRGGGAASREVHDLCAPGLVEADRMIVCEVLTPSGNWSSYPPHKHDEHLPGAESRLEEIYYFEAASAGSSDASEDPVAFGMFSAYSSATGAIEITETVRTGDIARVPYGYHGPAAAAPGYDLYYLNVMAGPDHGRHWLITDDPAHAWVRGTWAAAGIDRRLPFSSQKGEHRWQQ